MNTPRFAERETTFPANKLDTFVASPLKGFDVCSLIGRLKAVESNDNDHDGGGGNENVILKYNLRLTICLAWKYPKRS